MDPKENKTDELNESNEFPNSTINSETNGEKPKKVRRQATQEELDHPLHGVKLPQLLESLVDYYGWKYLADKVNIRCFKYNPTMKSSVRFLRKMKWAREHVEDLYMDMVEDGHDPKNKRIKE